MKMNKLKNKPEHIFTRLICGGIGYAPMLFRYKGKYYTLELGYNIKGIEEKDYKEKYKAVQREKEIYNKLICPLIEKYKNKSYGFTLWGKHRNDNPVSAEELLNIINISEETNE